MSHDTDMFVYLFRSSSHFLCHTVTIPLFGSFDWSSTKHLGMPNRNEPKESSSWNPSSRLIYPSDTLTWWPASRNPWNDLHHAHNLTAEGCWRCKAGNQQNHLRKSQATLLKSEPTCLVFMRFGRSIGARLGALSHPHQGDVAFKEPKLSMAAK